MNGRRSEMMHNTPEQAREYIAVALEIVAELEVPDDLRAVAFGNAVTLLSAKQITVEQIAPLGNALGLRPGN